MGTVRYTTVNGKIIAEKRNGVRSRYISDSLGSTVALLDNTQTKTDTFEYWPYGEVRNRTGTTPTPFQHVGTLGYYKDSASRTQVRARELDNQKGRWMTQDPIGFNSGDYNLYRYNENNPVTWADPSGTGCNLACWTKEYIGAVRDGIPAWAACKIANDACGCTQDCNNPPPVPDPPCRPGSVGPAFGAAYGQYCGPQTDPGKGEGIDELDACCKTHDECFANAKPTPCSAFNQWTRPDCKECNRALCDCARKASCKKWSGVRKAKCELARSITIRYACWAS